MLNTARAILAARMAEWTTTPICWPNTPPLTALNVPWVRFAVLGAGDVYEPLSAGAPVAEAGRVAVQVFVPSGSGDGTASTLADSIADLFRNYTSSKLQCGAIKRQTIGDADGWYQINISAPWVITE